MPRRNLAIAALAVLPISCCALRPPAKQRTTPTRRCSTTVAGDTVQKMERDGFAVLETTLLTPHILNEARDFVLARHATLIEAASKRGADLDRLDFYEIASRNPGRFDLRLDAKPAVWNTLEEAVLDASLKLPRAGTRPPRVEYAGAVVSEPGATAQKLHADGPPSSRGLYTVFVPLVDVPQDGDGTAFWPGSHASPSCLRAAAAFNAAKFEELPPDFELVAPGVARGSLLAFDYRVLHAGNPCARHRPVAYFVVNTRDDAVDDAWNWAPERLLPPGG